MAGASPSCGHNSLRGRPVVKTGGILTLGDMAGKAQVLVNGKLGDEKTSAEWGTIAVPVLVGMRDITVSVLIETHANFL